MNIIHTFKIKKSFRLIFFSILLLLVLSTCKVGLGDSVDVVAPSVSITYPAAKSVIKDSFVMSGAVNDDKTISEVSVSFTIPKASSSKVYGPYKATVDNTKKTWTVTLNTLDASQAYPIPDGFYEATVTAKDTANHTQSATKLYVIDNTAPVVYIDRPFGQEGSNADSFGSLLQLDALVGDENALSKVLFTVYAEDGTEIESHTVTENIENKLSLILGNYYGSNDQDLYKRLYNSQTPSGTKKFYYTVSLFDEAQLYKGSSVSVDTSLIGNKSTTFYLNGTIKKDSSTVTYNTLYTMASGSFYRDENGNEVAAKKTEAVNLLQAASTKALGPTKKGYFSINPDLSPEFSIGGLNPLTPSNTIETQTHTHQALSVSINPNRDNALLAADEEHIKVFATKAILSGGSYIPSPDASDKIRLQVKPDAETGDLFKVQNKVVSFNVNLNERTDTGMAGDKLAFEKWFIAVEGDDSEGHSIKAEDGKIFGFTLIGTDPAPSIDITEINGVTDSKNVSVKYDAELVVKGIATSKVSTTDKSLRLSYRIGSSGDYIEVSGASGLVPEGAGDRFWTLTIPSQVIASSVQKAVFVRVSDSSNNSSSVELSIFYDKESPVIDITSITPQIDANGKENNVNGEITVRGSVGDDDKVIETKVMLIDASTHDFKTFTTVPDGDANTASRFNFTIDTTSFTNQHNFELRFISKDKAGNIKTLAKTVFIDQSTDKPSLVLSNGSFGSVADAKTKVTNQNNMFNTTGNNMLLGQFSDDDGLKEAIVTIKNESDAVVGTPQTILLENKTTESLRLSLPSTEGLYKILIEVRDSNWLGVGTPNNSFITGDFWIAIDNGSPVLTVSNAQDEFVSNPVTVTGTARDGNGIKSIAVYRADGTTKIADFTGANLISGAFNANASNLNWSYSLDSDTGFTETERSVIFRAKDSFDNEIDFVYRFKIDKTAPTLSNLLWNGDDDGTSVHQAVFNDVSPYYRLSASVAEEPGGSGVEGVYYAYKQGSFSHSDHPLTADSSWVKMMKSTASSWIFDIPFSAIAEGDYTLFIKAVDNAGNVTHYATAKQFYIDTKAPLIAVTGADQTSGMKVKENITLTGSVDDTNAQTITALIKDSSNATVSGITLSPAWTDGSVHKAWSLVIPVSVAVGSSGVLSIDDSYTVQLIVSDSRSRSNTLNFILVRDTTAPSITIISPAVGEAVSSSTKTLRGTVSDTLIGSGIKDVSYTLKHGTTLIAKGANDGSVINLATKNYPLTLTGDSWNVSDIPLGSDEGGLSLEIIANDQLEHQKTKTVSFKFDKNNPTLNETSIGVSGLTTKDSFTLSGTATDSNALASSDAITIKDSVSSNVWSVSVASGNWSKEFVTGSANSSAENYIQDGTHVFTIIAKDAANKTTQLTRTVTVDTVLPVLQTPVVTTTPIDIDEGGAVDNWYNTSMLSLEVLAKDTNGTGIAVVEYSLDVGAVKTWTPMTFTKDGTTTADTSDGKATASIAVSDGSNTIFIRARDAASNIASASDTIVKVDTQLPTVSVTSPTGTKLVNGSSDITISGRASDIGSGLLSIKVKVNSNDFTSFDAESAVFDGSGNWSLTLSKEQFNSGGNVWAQISDKVGNIYKKSLFMLQVDSDSPSIAFTSPVANATINGSIDVSGTAGDTIGLESVNLFRQSSVSDWVLIETWSETSGYNWVKTGIDTKEASFTSFDSNTTAGNQVMLKAVARDKAGNETSVLCEITVDQDSDRPTIKFTNLDLSSMSSSTQAWLKNDTKILGTIVDDDGITSLKVSEDGTSYANITVDNGSWNYTVASDGSHTIYFKVIDSKGTEFISSATAVSTEDLMNTPKISDSDGHVFGTSDKKDSLLYLGTDKTIPTVNSFTYKVFDSKTSSYSSSWLTSYTTEKFGGKNSKMNIQFVATDTNGIASVEAKLSSQSLSGSYSGSDAVLKNGLWQCDDILLDKDSVSDGSQTLNVVVTDKAGLKTTQSYILSIDNTAPTVSIVEPTTTIRGAEIIRGSVDQTSTVYYAVTKTQSEAVSTWNEVRGAGLSWALYFDGEADTSTTEHDKMLKDFIVDLGIVGDLTGYTDITTVYIRAKGVDSYGNEAESSIPVRIDPQGDRPVVAITYPENNAKLGGTIKIMGIAEDNVSVASVWVEIDVDNDGDFDSDDETALASYYTVETVNYKTAAGVSQQRKAIKATLTGSSWNLAINSNGEFNPSGDGTKTLSIKAFALDNNTTISEDAPCILKIDKDTPIIVQDSLSLIQYEVSSGVACTDGSVTSGTIAATQVYKEGMSIKGIWFLTGRVIDASGIKTIVKNGTDILKDTIVVGSETECKLDTYTGSVATGDDSYTGYSFQISVGSTTSDSVGTTEITLSATENTDNNLSVSKNFSVHYDNYAPVVVNSSDSDYNVNATIVNRNGFYTLSSKATEAAIGGVNQTGIERVAFYFTRSINSTHALYDVMLQKGDSNQSLDYTDASISKVDGLYWKKKTGVTVSGSSLTLSSRDDNTHTGSLVKVGGVTYRIDNLSSDGLTLSLSGSPDSSITECFIALAQIIDNTTSETAQGSKNAAGYYEDALYDDGDDMLESLIKQSSTYIWEASINSNNIPDGPIAIHYVVFDKAGNYSENEILERSTSHTQGAFVSNNQPRIAGIKLGSDDNGNGSVESSEMNTTMSGLHPGGLDVSGAKLTTVDFPNQSSGSPSALNVKGDAKIIPEIVGGNGDIGYTFGVSRNAESTEYYKKTTAVSFAKNGNDGITNTSQDFEINLSVRDFLSAGDVGSEIEDGTHQKFAFKMWDSTAGTTQGLDSQYATINLFMDVALRDTTKPTNVITPFYWKSHSENSLYQNSKTNGHIELPEDLESAGSWSTPFTQTSGVFDKDAKISGIVTIEGEARDNANLKTLTAKIDGFDADGSSSTYAEGSTFIIAEFNAGVWTPMGSLPANGWQCEIVESTFSNATGHVVSWKLHFDSSKIANAVKKDVKVIVGANDKGKATLVSTNVSYTSNNSVTDESTTTVTTNSSKTFYNKVDVVPYITQIETGLDKGSRLHPSVLNRSSLGKYTLNRSLQTGTTYSAETVVVHGFNLNPSSDNLFVVSSEADALNASYETIVGSQIAANFVTEVESHRKYEIVLSSIADSGFLSFVQKDGSTYIPVLNNINKNESLGEASSSASNKYNYEPNNRNNNILTDDRYLQFWNTSTVDNIGDVRLVDMAISGDNINFSAGEQDTYFSVLSNITNHAVSSTSRLRRSYTRYFDNAIAYNSDGTPYAISSCGDSLGSPITSWSTGPSKFALTRGLFNTATRNEYGDSTNPLFLESNWNGAQLNNLSRNIWHDIAVRGNNVLTRGYISYYDSTQKLVKFRYFEDGTGGTAGYTTSAYLGGTSTLTPFTEGAENRNSTEQAVARYTDGANTYNQGYIAIAGSNANSPYSTVEYLSDGTAIVSWYDANLGALKMKSNISPQISFSGYQRFTAVPTPGAVTFTISVDGGAPRAVTVNYVALNNNTRTAHEFAYQLNKVLVHGYNAYAEVDPVSNNVVVRSMQTGTASSIAITALSSGTVATAVPGCGQPWVEVIVDANQAGKFVSLAVDSKNGLHFAYQDSGNGDLKYAYMQSPSSVPVSMTVDAYQQTGAYTDIAVKEEVVNGINSIVPYISYYAMSYADTKYSVKLARLNQSSIPVVGVPTIDFRSEGSNSQELYTGNWDVMTVPTGEVPTQYRVNIGIKSNGDVVLGYKGDTIEYAILNE